MFETIIGVGILVVVVLVAKKVFARNGSSTHTPVSGGTPYPSTGPDDDTAIIPPTGTTEL